MNKMRFGNQEGSILLWFMSIVPLVIVLLMNPPLVITVCIFASIVFGLFAISWLPYLITKYHLRPGIDKCGSNETTWLRITKDRMIMPQFDDKGPYGQTKGITYGEKADVIDDGAFPIRWVNGNPGILMYDLMNTSVDLNKSVARKKMKEEYGIRSGIDGYQKAKKEKERVHDR